jgi:hypothetical protein
MADVWPVILGADGVPPRDGLMVEAIDARGGDGPIQPGVGILGTLRGPEEGPRANLANGHEYVQPDEFRDDLQYACIFPLAKEDDCTDHDPPPPVQGVRSEPADYKKCDCSANAVAGKNPLCQAADGSYSRTQRYGKAYPSIRELQVLKDFGENSIVASICAKNLHHPDRQDYGYRPAVDALIDRLKDALTSRCLPRRLTPDEHGDVPCSVIEASPEGTCDAARGRVPASDRVRGATLKRLEAQGLCGNEGQQPCGAFTLCELSRAGAACLREGEYTGTPGWCYVDPLPPEQGGQSLGDVSLVADCKDPARKRIIRFVDPENATPAPGSRVIIACFGADLGSE